MIALLLALAAPVAVQAPAPILRTPEQARSVVRRYYAAIDRGDHRTAWRQWGDGGRPGQTYAQFVRGFARTAHTSVVAGRPTDGDAGAGSVYITVPVEVRATLTNGARQRFTGRYVLRRVNDVDGATRAQLSWHLTSATLRPAR